MSETTKQVHVIMGNDYPHSVYADLSEADKFCAEEMAAQKVGKKDWETPRIYWRVYSFTMIDKGSGK